MSVPEKKILFLQRQSPGIDAREALDAALVAGVFEQDVSLLFRDAGVLQLAGTDDSEFDDLVRSLTDYGVEAVYVCSRSIELQSLDLGNLIVPATPLSANDQARLISTHDAVVND